MPEEFSQEKKDQRPPRVVILGGGYGGVYAALKLQNAARKGQIELSLVSRDNFFLRAHGKRGDKYDKFSVTSVCSVVNSKS
jgi:hypothetical protein